MPSLVTGVIGGIQGSRAAHHAAEKLAQGYQQAGQTVTGAVNQVNPEILATAQQAGQDVLAAGRTAGEGVTTAAQQGMAGATGAADKLMGLLSPYMQAGASAAEQLPGAAQPFTASMMSQYSPAYQFQLQQGELAAKRAAAAGGVTGAGGTMRSLNRYAQDYARTAFKDASDIYGQNFNRLATLANIGQTAATTGGQAGLQAAEYAGNLGTGAAEYAGTMGANTAQWAGTQNIGARNLASSNTLSGANYLANTQIGAQQALAQGDLGAASAWNNMLGSIGQTGDTLLFGGLGGAAGTTPGWSFGNIGKNIWGSPRTKAPSSGGYWAPGYGPNTVLSDWEIGG